MPVPVDGSRLTIPRMTTAAITAATRARRQRVGQRRGSAPARRAVGPSKASTSVPAPSTIHTHWPTSRLPKTIPSSRPAMPTTSSSRWTTSHAVARASNTRSSRGRGQRLPGGRRAAVGQEVVGATHHRPSMAAPGSAVEAYSALASPQPCQWSTRIQQLTRGRSRLA